MNLKNLTSVISGIADNSKNVKRGYIFFALPGIKSHGDFYIKEAINNGAKLIVMSKESHFKENSYSNDIKFIKVSNTKQYLSNFLSLYYKKKPKYLVGVTGTNGKTSSVKFFQQICTLLSYKSSSISTLGVSIPNKHTYYDRNNNLTSPTQLEIHKNLNKLYKKGCSHVSLEASSHGICQHRLDNINFNSIGFTNFSHDHLDYHNTLQEYFNAKLRIFNEVLQEGKHAILNSDIKEFNFIKQKCHIRKIKVISYGKKKANLRILPSTQNRWKVEIFGKKYCINPKIKEDFQLYNILCSIGLALTCDIDKDKILNVIDKLEYITGRLQLVRYYKGAKIYVDYAHTPNALKIVLETLRKICQGNLHVLFGCGGERDKYKRSMMGSIAQHYADYVVITDDNPREEEASSIRKAILQSCSKGKEIIARAEAIRYAIKKLSKNDILVIAGKGHENYQVIGKKITYFSDFEEIRKYEE